MIKNEDAKDNLRIATIKDKMRENCLKLFGHIYRRPKLAVAKKSDNIQIVIKRKRELPTKLGLKRLKMI